MTDSDRVPAILVGKAIGDALGMPFEASGDKLHPGLLSWHGDYREGTWHKLPAGHWTDDTEMAIELAKVLIENNGTYVVEDAARKYLAWADGTPHGMGGTTRKAMEALRQGKSCKESGVVFPPGSEATIGNGPAMRIAPLGLVFMVDGEWETLEDAVQEDSQITHNHRDAMIGAMTIAVTVSYLVDFHETRDELMGTATTAADAFDSPVGPMSLVVQKLNQAAYLLSQETPTFDAIRAIGATGNIASTVASAVYCAAFHADDFEEGVIAAIKGGGDTDTRGAITGAILGANLGLKAIPQKYLDGLHQFEMLKELDRKLLCLRLDHPVESPLHPYDVSPDDL